MYQLNLYGLVVFVRDRTTTAGSRYISLRLGELARESKTREDAP